MAPDAPDLIPVHVITGFLGSGKTTLLRQALASPAFANTAVVVNEFGEVALDHLLLQRVDPDTVVLQTGCVCCTLRSELGAALRDAMSAGTEQVIMLGSGYDATSARWPPSPLRFFEVDHPETQARKRAVIGEHASPEPGGNMVKAMRAVRKAPYVVALGVAITMVGSLGVASAATGGNFILGHVNSANATIDS